jgi:RNA polymerase sigma-70 factor, ECF subfamily
MISSTTTLRKRMPAGGGGDSPHVSPVRPLLGDLTPTQLMLRVRCRDEPALEELIRRFRDRVVNEAGRIVGSDDSAEDVAQEVFVRIWERRSDWRPSGSVPGYLLRMTRNLALNRIRGEHSRRERAARFQREEIRPGPTPGEELELAELRRRLSLAIRGLSPRRREVFVRARLQRRSYREVAHKMRISSQTVANHLSRATAELRQALSS